MFVGRVGVLRGKYVTPPSMFVIQETDRFPHPGVIRMVKDATLQPPWCLTLRVLGHTFLGEQFLAKASLSTHQTGHKLCFPACHLGDTVYQTIRYDIHTMYVQ